MIPMILDEIWNRWDEEIKWAQTINDSSHDGKNLWGSDLSMVALEKKGIIRKRIFFDDENLGMEEHFGRCSLAPKLLEENLDTVVP